MAKITYILGAGASAKALPTVDQISKGARISGLARKLEGLKLSDNDFFNIEGKPLSETKWHYQKQLIKELDWLQEVSNTHASVDTYAKKLTIRCRYEELQKLKIALSIYLALEQMTNGLDKRYDSFFASIIDADGMLPHNVTILSWNYDTQFELGFSEFTGETNLAMNTKLLGIRAKNTSRVKPNGLPIYRLNGVGGFKEKGTSIIRPFGGEAKAKLNLDFAEQVVKQYVDITMNENIVPTLSFAWEIEHDSRNSILDDIKGDLRGTSVVVVIGYSFPFFNRDFDKKIFTFMSGVKKIYYQDMYPHKLVERLKAVGQFREDVEIFPYSEVEQFFIPYEL